MGHKEAFPVTHLRKTMLEKLQRRNLSKLTAIAMCACSRSFPSTTIVLPTS